MRQLFLLTLFVLGTTEAFGLTLKLYRLPESTSPQDRLYAAGTFNQWNPGDPNALFQKDEQGVWTLTLPDTSPLEFKITRGSWATVERDEDGRDIPNRRIPAPLAGSVRALSIGSWADRPAPFASTRSGQIEVLDFPLNGFGTRKIWIYLPPDYARSTKAYPVLYMYDAQNLFDRRSAAFGQEWNVDESLEELFYEEAHPGLIVVAVDNSSRRGCEYNVFPEDPHPFCADGSALGEAFNAAMVQDLKPWIDQRYRTQSDRAHTFVMGSSMGGQMALAMGLRWPSVFSRVFALSPSYQNQLKNPFRMPTVIEALKPSPELFVYQDIGDAEVIRELKAPTLIRNMLTVQEALRAQGFASDRNEARVIPGAEHNEKAWSGRFKDLIRRLAP